MYIGTYLKLSLLRYEDIEGDPVNEPTTLNYTILVYENIYYP